jgi:hypothetical protein
MRVFNFRFSSDRMVKVGLFSSTPVPIPGFQGGFDQDRSRDEIEWQWDQRRCVFFEWRLGRQW